MRLVSLGNGRLLVNLDEFGRIVDLYYPYVGLENQIAGIPEQHYVRVNEPKEVSQLSPQVRFVPKVNTCQAEFRADSVVVTRTDFLDVVEPVMYRIVRLYNPENVEKGVTMSWLMDVNLYSNRVGDSGFYDPELKGLVVYKSKRYMAVKAFCSNGCDTSYALGKGDLAEDAKDGWVEFRAADNGDIFLGLSVSTKVPPNGAVKVYLAYSFGESYKEAVSRLANVGPTGVEISYSVWSSFWNTHSKRINPRDRKYDFLARTSVAVILAHTGQNGSIIASSDYSYTSLWGDYYNYVWPRDAGIAAHALDLVGFRSIALRHYNSLPKLVSSHGFLFQKYNPDLTLASSWHPRFMDGKPVYPIQEDETAIELWAIGEHHSIYNDLDDLVQVYKGFVKPAIKFVMGFVEDGLPKPSWDLWEERYGVHIWTVSTVYAGLRSVKRLVEDMGDHFIASDIDSFLGSLLEATKRRMVHEGRFVRMLNKDGQPDLTVDASMLAPAIFGMVDPKDPIMAKTAELVEQKLKVNGGLIRYENDPYRKEKASPNPWLITTLWLARYKVLVGKRDEALALLDWVAQRATPTGLLPEQVDPETLMSTNVIPLVWSHAEFIITLKSLELL
ncbi:MAG: glycoside hydrolase family 15 protein [Thermoprotei archaeon]